VTAFVDTSALYPLLVRNDDGHDDVARTYRVFVEGRREMWTTSYVLLEVTALLQHRIGMEPVRDLWDALVPLLSVEWVSEPLHRRGLARLWREDRRKVSLVDCVSFEFMAQMGLREAIALDPHFADAGFRLVDVHRRRAT
jgi:uncharacterized protein